ncbi:SDR family oxidoreductase [Yoonia maritima]|uniref:SDR family oxidoreductase n=1 Tax=Yoonia maritima TaxID=1435347 RepID=UPI00373567F2
MSYIERMRPEPGKKVLITAGASGIGAAIAKAYLEAGAKVAICDVDRAAIEQFTSENTGVCGIVADVSDPIAVSNMLETVERDLGGLDMLINNAGIAGPTGPIEELALDDIRKTLDIDLLSQFIVIRQAVPLLAQSSNASIINVASVAGRLGYPLRTPYAAAKWGIVGLTASLAKEMGPRQIRVNAILPGPVLGPRMDGVIRDKADAEGRSLADVGQEFVANISLRRMVGPEDIAGMALFLGSPAGANIAGQAISVCGNVETL